eukprot:scaffold129644_cov41-Tisochrysis_lutea.AAC.2
MTARDGEGTWVNVGCGGGGAMVVSSSLARTCTRHLPALSRSRSRPTRCKACQCLKQAMAAARTPHDGQRTRTPVAPSFIFASDVEIGEPLR